VNTLPLLRAEIAPPVLLSSSVASTNATAVVALTSIPAYPFAAMTSWVRFTMFGVPAPQTMARPLLTLLLMVLLALSPPTAPLHSSECNPPVLLVMVTQQRRVRRGVADIISARSRTRTATGYLTGHALTRRRLRCARRCECLNRVVVEIDKNRAGAGYGAGPAGCSPCTR
jgi:hypothetical protein